uniref:RRM domain-containing protein n=1 Tax=Monopterus albus TaxID=43700 RepID=A0A3Q3J3B2_MONAL
LWQDGRTSGEAPSGGQSDDYVVGQVSGSLFQKNSAASGSLSALFGTAAPAAPIVFQPAPEVNENTKLESQHSQKKKKPPKQKSAADQKLENRESSLQNADEDERGQGTSMQGKRKRKELGEEKDVEHWVMKRQRLKASREEESMKRKRTVFVGNLPVSCTKKVVLCFLFRDKGSIESIRFRSVVKTHKRGQLEERLIKSRKIHPKKQSINAYVVFKDEEAVAKALERNGTEIEDNFHVRVDRVTDSSSHDHKRSVFVGNLPFEINELVFRRHFEECGAVEAVRLVRDQNSGMGKGFGYVLFESPDSVQLALKLDGSKLEGRSIRVKRSVKKEKQKNKTDSSRNTGRPSRGPSKHPTKGPVRASEREKGGTRGGFKSPWKSTRNQHKSHKCPTSFKGEMVEPNKKNKKRLKKKPKPNKTVHI